MVCVCVCVCICSVSSSTSTDTDGPGAPRDPYSAQEDNQQPKSLNLMTFPEQPKQDYQLLQDKVSKLYTKQDSGYHGYESGGHGNQEYQYNVRQATQEYNANRANSIHQGLYRTNMAGPRDSDNKGAPQAPAKPVIPRSVTDPHLKQRQRQDSIDMLSQGSIDRQSMDSIDSSDRGTRSSRPPVQTSTDQTGKNIAHIATLPRKPKQAKPLPNPSQEAEVYQAYLQRQRSYEDTKEDTKPCTTSDLRNCEPKAKEGLLINHARQWSKEEIRKLLVQDYYDRSGVSSKGQQSRDPSFERNLEAKGKGEAGLQREQRSRESSIDGCSEESFPPPPPPIAQQTEPAPSARPAPSGISRSNSQPGRPANMPTTLNATNYEDLINKQLRQMALRERAREPGAPEGPAFQIKEKSHYAYRHQINLPPRPGVDQPYTDNRPAQQGSSGPVRVMPQTHPVVQAAPSQPPNPYTDRKQAPPQHPDQHNTQATHQQGEIIMGPPGTMEEDTS